MTSILPVLRPSRLTDVPPADPPPLPPDGEPEVWEVSAEEFAPAAHALADTVLDAAERGRAARLRHLLDRDVYVAAHVGLRLMHCTPFARRPVRK
ncbi:hypothetical protein [Streptomyces sp. Wb2n-11]|uniref:hypothetical protein n=1 Tax=Streptomyces sp. Wb2n-11 TaxID=1030533 RepID=UPI000AAA9E53|nr:hypothetical protein [Streptomyces sp. Wb2n-11]